MYLLQASQVHGVTSSSTVIFTFKSSSKLPYMWDTHTGATWGSTSVRWHLNRSCCCWTINSTSNSRPCNYGSTRMPRWLITSLTSSVLLLCMMVITLETEIWAVLIVCSDLHDITISWLFSSVPLRHCLATRTIHVSMCHQTVYHHRVCVCDHTSHIHTSKYCGYKRYSPLWMFCHFLGFRNQL